MDNLDKLIHLIQERRELYDFNLTEHSNREVQNKSWEEIAIEMGSSVSECKNKWTNLRNSYARELREDSKAVGQCGKRKRRWYLMETMSFMRDFMKNRSISDSSHCEEGSSLITKIESPTEERGDRIYEPQLWNEDFNIPQKMTMATIQGNESEDTDHMFFKSLLPDVKRLSIRRCRHFKGQVLNLLNSLLDEQDNELVSGPPTSALSPDPQPLPGSRLEDTLLATCLVKENPESPHQSEANTTSADPGFENVYQN